MKPYCLAGTLRIARRAWLWMAAFWIFTPTASAQMIAPAAGGQPMSNIQYAYGPRGQIAYLTGVNGTAVTLPVARNNAGYSRQSGLQLSIDPQWPGEFGYKPVTITVRTSKPAAADKEIRILFHAGSWQSRGKSITAQQDFTLKQSAASATVKVLVPDFEGWDNFGWEILVDGQRDDHLGVKQLPYASMGGSGSNNMGVMVTSLSSSQQSSVFTALAATFQGQNVAPRMELEKDLPIDWVLYTPIDVFIIPADKLPELKQRYPKQAAALLRWVRSGGNLWLIESGSRWQRLAEVERALGLPTGAPQNDDADNEDDAILARGWKFAPLGERATEPEVGGLLLSGFETAQEERAAPRYRPGRQPPVNALAETSRRWFAVRGFGLGAVTAFRRGLHDSFSTTSGLTLTAITQSPIGPRATWATRHGNSPDGYNVEFNNLLIPNVGVAPVGQFQFLITLFVLGIGPLNYWLLKRKNKLPLLLATAPIAAALTTALLFSYGLLADGFGVRVRARTLTMLDQRAGEASSWGRLSYYAGIAPRGGLALPRDQVLYPILPEWGYRHSFGGRSYNPPREVVWTDQQRLTRGWLQSRTPTQYHAIAARPSSKKLELRSTANGLRVVNRLGVDVVEAAVQDHGGKFYWCENLAADEGRVVPATDQTKLATQIRRQFTAHLPEFPGGEQWNYSGYYGFSLSQSAMESRMEAINSPLVSGWGNGTYIAFTKQAVELDLGVDDAEEEASFHVIEGKW